MRRSNFALRLAPSVLEETRKVARREGIAVNQFITLAVVEKVTAMETETYFRERAARADVPKALRLLKHAGEKNRPMKGDELPPD
jgi:hypothetical protein